MEEAKGSFIWDQRKERVNTQKHGISFSMAAQVFKDPKRVILIDSKHSQKEQRYFCIGKVRNRIMTVRFIYRDGIIRIYGAGYWRKGREYYEEA
ncbi:MAG: BrnT family toxin [Candidatus Omnitrophica bacterium]|nr:BrnT family toxin [Candidatus Omnitrophota bacterium]